MSIKYSKDIHTVLNKAREIAKDHNRPYVCHDILWAAILDCHSGSLEDIFEDLGFELVTLKLIAYSIVSDKKESKKPATHLNKDVREILKLAEKLRKILSEEDLTVELLVLALFTFDKSCKFFNFLLSEYELDQEDYIKCATCFITDRPFEIEYDEDGFEIEVDYDPENLDPYMDNPILEEYGVNLNKEAAQGKYDNLIPIEDKIKKLSIVLCRTNKPNAIIVGPQGGGKTSVIMSLAKKIVDGDVSEHLQDKVIFEISLGSMVAGTEFRGNFEDRLKGIIEEAKQYNNVILFFDEIHTLIGAGGTGRKGDLEASNILKPYLATGEICCIGATTDYEYNQKFKKDKALDRRFEKIDFAPPTREQAEKMAPTLIEFYENQNGIKFCESFKERVVPLCEQLMPNRNYPDKLVDAIDFSLASAKVEKEETVTRGIYEDYFLDKSGVLGDDENLKELNKEIPNKEIKKTLLKFSKNVLEERDLPRTLTLCGDTEITKIISKFLKRKGFNHFVFSGKSLNDPFNIIGFSEDYLCSLAQKVSVSESPVVIINDCNSIGHKAEILLSEILSEGQITMRNGEDVSFKNTLFILNCDIEKSGNIGFQNGENGKTAKLPKLLKKSLDNVIIV